MQRQDDFQKILIDLSILRYVVKSNVNACHYDINHECENFYRDILNVLWDCNLRNLNRDEKNAKGIDLIDDDKKIAVQVTSNKSSDKIKETIRKFEQKYDRRQYKLFMLNILSKSHPTTSITYADKTAYEMERSIDVDDILVEIEDSGADKIREIREKVDLNLGYYKKFLNKDSSLYTFFESSAKPYSTLNGLKKIVYVDDECKQFLDKIYTELKNAPREMRKAVWVFLTRCESEVTKEQLYFAPHTFNQYIREAGLNDSAISEYVKKDEILYYDEQHIRINEQSYWFYLRKIRADVLESIILGPDFSLLDNVLPLSDF